MRKTNHEITTPAPSTTGRQATANENRPAQSPSAREMIAEAEAARASIDAAGDEAPAAEEAEDGQVDNKTPASGQLPTMEELELARDEHTRKIAGEAADRED